MDTIPRKFKLQRHLNVKCASLVIVLLVMTVYYRAGTNIVTQTLVHSKQYLPTLSPQQSKPITHGKKIDGNVDIRRLAAAGTNIVTQTLVHSKQYLPTLSPRHSKPITHGKKIDGNVDIRRLAAVDNVVGERRNVVLNLTRKAELPPFEKYWAKILHFVPEHNNQNCLSLFTTESSQTATITPEWEEVRGSVRMSEFNITFAPQHMKQTLMYQELARLEFVHTVCEIGFNVGQSAIAWLTAKPDLKLYSFDIGGTLPQKMGRALGKLFPDRFELTIGDSRKTVPQWVKRGVKCDIVFIDGGHTYPIVHPDILNMQKAAAKQHIIVLDDIYYPGVNKAWKEMVENNIVHHLFDCRVPGQDIDFALGYYKEM